MLSRLNSKPVKVLVPIFSFIATLYPPAPQKLFSNGVDPSVNENLTPQIFNESLDLV